MRKIEEETNHLWQRVTGVIENLVLWELSLHKSSIEMLRRERELPDQVIYQIQHRGLVNFYQYIHSLFDPNGIDFRKYSAAFKTEIEVSGTLLFANFAVDLYSTIESEISRVRNNIGAHYGQKTKSIENGYGAFGALNVRIGTLILHSISVVIRGLRRTHPLQKAAMNFDDDSFAAVQEQVLREVKHINASDIQIGTTTKDVLGKAEQEITVYMAEKYYSKGVHPLVSKRGFDFDYTVVRE